MLLAYKSKIQSTVSTSSTEAEFLAAVHAAKIAKYLRSILSVLISRVLTPSYGTLYGTLEYRMVLHYTVTT